MEVQLEGPLGLAAETINRQFDSGDRSGRRRAACRSSSSSGVNREYSNSIGLMLLLLLLSCETTVCKSEPFVLWPMRVLSSAREVKKKQCLSTDQAAACITVEVVSDLGSLLGHALGLLANICCAIPSTRRSLGYCWYL
jgi:hypothetical protein